MRVAGYAFADALYAGKVIAVTDNLAPYPVSPVSIDETLVDYVVVVDCIGDPAGIVSAQPVSRATPWAENCARRGAGDRAFRPAAGWVLVPDRRGRRVGWP